MLAVLAVVKTAPIVLVDGAAKKAVLGHLTSKNTELGGLLIGKVYSWGDLEHGLVAIRITRINESRQFESTGVSLSMGGEVWTDAALEPSSGELVVGWYHSHPNLGAFFSGIDRNTQSKFFSYGYSLGLVVDPVRGDERWFRGRESIEINPSNVVHL